MSMRQAGSGTAIRLYLRHGQHTEIWKNYYGKNLDAGMEKSAKGLLYGKIRRPVTSWLTSSDSIYTITMNGSCILMRVLAT